MYMNIEYVTDTDFESMWVQSIKHMTSSTFSPHVITQDEDGNYWADGQVPFKEFIKESMQMNPCMVFREHANAVAYVAFSGEKIDDIWHSIYFMAGPKEGSTSMAWIYTEIALVSYARHKEVTQHTGLYGMNMTTSSEESSLNAFVIKWGAKRVGTSPTGGPMWQTRWRPEREDIIPYDLR
jgi:hypothetical protein